MFKKKFHSNLFQLYSSNSFQKIFLETKLLVLFQKSFWNTIIRMTLGYFFFIPKYMLGWNQYVLGQKCCPNKNYFCCSAMSLEYISYHTNTVLRCLSKGTVINRFFFSKVSIECSIILGELHETLVSHIVNSHQWFSLTIGQPSPSTKLVWAFYSNTMPFGRYFFCV